MSPRRMPGRWAPAHEAPFLLTLQLLALWQAGLRALDYLTGAGGPALDEAAAGQVTGALLYAAVLVAVTGIAARRAPLVVAGHLLLAVWYAQAGTAALTDRVHVGPAAIAAAAAGGLGVWLVARDASSWPARLGGLALMLGSQAAIAATLGGDYRTATGLLSAAVQHYTFAAATFVLWQRRGLREVVEREQGRAGP